MHMTGVWRGFPFDSRAVEHVAHGNMADPFAEWPLRRSKAERIVFLGHGLSGFHEVLPDRLIPAHHRIRERVGSRLCEDGNDAASQHEDGFQNGGPLAHWNMAQGLLQAGGGGLFGVTLRADESGTGTRVAAERHLSSSIDRS